MSNDFVEVLKRIDSGSRDEADIQALLLAVQQKQVALAMGDRAVALGGDASDAIIVTGDNNFTVVLKGERAEQVQKLAQGQAERQYVQDTVYSTFFPVSQIPQYIYAVPCKYNDSDTKAASQAIQFPSGSSYMYPFLIRNGKLFCFQDLSFRTGAFRELIGDGNLERYDAIDWWNEPEQMNWYMTLLNRSLNKLTGRRGLNLDRQHSRYFFPPIEADQVRKEKFRPLNQSSRDRNVVWQPITKKTNKPKPYWLHRAVALKFHHVAANQWCLSIRPELRVTKDGFISLDSDEVGRKITRKKSKMFNDALLSEVNFWRDYLSSGTSKIILPFSKTQKIIISTSMMESEVEWLGIPEERLIPFKNVHYEDDPLMWDESEDSIDEEDSDDWDEQAEFDDEVETDDSLPF